MPIYNFENTYNKMPEWVLSAKESFKRTMLSKTNPFPCYFAKLGLEQSSFRYSYILKDELTNPIGFKNALNEYLTTYKELDWPSVFIVFIQTKSNDNLKNHETIFWNILQYLVNSDEHDWPNEISKDPNNYKWQFCFQGTPLFINGHSSAYKNRKSRLSSSDMMMVIQTVETLKPVTGLSKNSTLIRTNIRNRVSQYDNIPVSPLLGSYPSKESHEWKQFWLPDTNIDKGKCPLGFEHNETN